MRGGEDDDESDIEADDSFAQVHDDTYDVDHVEELEEIENYEELDATLISIVNTPRPSSPT